MKQNLWKTVFKKFEVVLSAYLSWSLFKQSCRTEGPQLYQKETPTHVTDHITSIFQMLPSRLPYTNFTLSILKYLVSFINHLVSSPNTMKSLYKILSHHYAVPKVMAT